MHAVLERLFDLPPHERTLERARTLLQPAWDELCEEDASLAPALFSEATALEVWMGSAGPLLEAYFALEDPTRLSPAARELKVSHTTDAGLLLRGIVDRLDEAGPHSPMAGALRVIDYKTGKAPGPAFEARVMFQLKFYALVLWRTRGVVPAMLELLYLGGKPERLRYAPDEAELDGFERTLHALGAAIQRAHETGDWRPRASRLCDWCSHQALCPLFGGTPPAASRGRRVHADRLCSECTRPQPRVGRHHRLTSRPARASAALWRHTSAARATRPGTGARSGAVCTTRRPGATRRESGLGDGVPLAQFLDGEVGQAGDAGPAEICLGQGYMG